MQICKEIGERYGASIEYRNSDIDPYVSVNRDGAVVVYGTVAPEWFPKNAKWLNGKLFSRVTEIDISHPSLTNDSAIQDLSGLPKLQLIVFSGFVFHQLPSDEAIGRFYDANPQAHIRGAKVEWQSLQHFKQNQSMRQQRVN
jgi:hypothetical protein